MLIETKSRALKSLDRKIRVLQVGKFYYPEKGGMEEALYNLCSALKESVDLHVLVANRERETVSELVDGVSVTRVSSFDSIFSTSICPSFPEWISSFDVDIIHLHEPNPLATVSYLRAKPKGRLLVHYHSDIIRQKFIAGLYKLFLRKILQQADRIIVATPNHIKYSPLLSEVSEKCVVIPFGIDIARLGNKRDYTEKVDEIRSRFGERIILFVGRIVYYKGLEYLIDAMESVDATLLIVGEGPLREKLQIYAKNSYALDKKIVFLGEVDRQSLPAYYQACKIFVLPSIYKTEAFGMTQLEAMASGRPVISTDLPSGVPWVNQHEITGLIVPPRNSAALADSINYLLGDERLRKELGENGTKWVQLQFTKEQMGSSVLQIYEQVVRADHILVNKPTV